MSRKVGASERRWMHDELLRREGGCRRKGERVEEGKALQRGWAHHELRMGTKERVN